jgi:hypothetical protein
MAYHYELFGLRLESDLLLAGIQQQPRTSGATDLRIALAAGPLLEPSPEAFMVSRYQDQFLWLAWQGVGSFSVHRELGITIYPLAEASPFLIQQPMLGPVMALWFQMRGFLVLHGSAVAIRGRALLILADSGTGKSTLASALLERGASLVSDDLCILSREGNGWSVRPEVPRLKLNPDSLAATRPGLGDVPLIPGDEKGEVRLGPIGSASLPVGAIADYSVGEVPDVTPHGPIEGFFALRRHTFTHSMEATLQLQGDAFAQCAELAREILPKRLVRSANWSEFPAVLALAEGLIP